MPSTMINTRPLTAPPLPPAPSRRRFLAPAIALAVVSAALAGGLALYDYQSDQRDQRVADMVEAISGTPSTVGFVVAEPPAIITSSEYQQITEGMTYEEVVRIIDTAGTELSRSDIGGISTVMYEWVNDDGSNMNAIFQDATPTDSRDPFVNTRDGLVLVMKAQFGL